MEGFRIRGGRKISGSTEIHSAKNAVLPIMAAALMTDDDVTLTDCPKLSDIENMCLILSSIGSDTSFFKDRIHICSRNAHVWEIPRELTGRLRSSIFMLGPMLGRFGKAKVAYPGGCDIGQRPIDLHLKGLQALGAEIHAGGGSVELTCEKLKGTEILLDFPSVGATENIMMAACFAKGQTMIMNAAQEPEIADLARFINRMGGRIRGAGESCVVIEGVKRLNGCTYRPMPDRIVAGTLLAAAAITGGDIALRHVCADDICAVIGKLREAGCEVKTMPGAIRLRATDRLKSVNVDTRPYPGFPTDMQSPMTALLCACDGVGIVTENMFENRFAHVGELRRMGADITLTGRNAIVRSSALTGTRVKACDLRAGAALVLAGLYAQGVTEIENACLIDRGYDNMEATLSALGADIQRVKYMNGERETWQVRP